MNSEKINFKKINYFLMFSNVIKNKMENNFQCLVFFSYDFFKIIFVHFIFLILSWLRL